MSLGHAGAEIVEVVALCTEELQPHRHAVLSELPATRNSVGGVREVSLYLGGHLAAMILNGPHHQLAI